MKITSELNLLNFEFWSGAKQHNFTYSELKEIQYLLEDIYPDGITETEINDLFWFDEELLCDLISLSYGKYLNR